MDDALQLGPAVQHMSDEKILDRWNEGVRARDQVAAEYEHIAVEVPPGKPRIEYFEKREEFGRLLTADAG